MGDMLWTPPADVRERSRIGDYLRWLAEHRGLEFADYDALWRWSVTDLDRFWRSIWDYFEVVAHTPPTATLADRAMPGARWFPGATLNYAENVLRMPGRGDDDPVVIAYGQTRAPETLTAGQLREQVRRVAAGLRRLGVGQGDRVAAYAPNIPETFVLLLATASLGAIFSSCAPEFGTRSVTDRWQQIEPKVLVAVDGYRYGDKPVDRRGEVAAIRAALPSLAHTVGIAYLDPSGAAPAGAISWAELAAETDEPLTFTPVPFDHPLYVLYSSGTTGLPKPIVHGHGGILLEHLKMLALHHDLGPSDRFFWFTTTGWMMWNFLVSGPAVGATIVLFDGNPGHPDLGALWRLAAETGTTYFGTSAPFLLACRKANLVPKAIADLSALRGVGSTGAPLPVEGFTWVYENVGDNLQLQSLSGGTDVCTGFVGGVPLLPVYAGEIACRALGAKVEARSADGTPVIGELGELVITEPMPSMPVGFWNDPEGARYREAYFEVYPGVWRHGDWITVNERGGCVITGRSDATLNRGGVRLGTAEFYSVVEGLDEVVDSVVVHLEDDQGGAGELLLFVVLAEGLELDDELRKKICRELRTALSPRHVPDEIHQVRAVPRTLSAKKLEVPVKKILTGTPVDRAAAKGALANPDSLTAFAALAQRRAPTNNPTPA
ncbi:MULTISPECIES: acetoacetate--CoA ligase [Micromonospora]|uniref:Acetoacetate--CoA ligase n=1 Tax=Micromonospora solifontis TaxID=2487138 RepID=A0ABX9WH80_9ACTN|nr:MULTISPECIES: acetoacetate--CoA ligase [Micromonospora]NES15221.1 acetoacetate--CoA ligase [Micromonospora sp. PPF5-17B]NES36493.1 acetoacetate--CoA ligase [Micromonospora solifontis]NES56363.1 acetoacetate--CoA ligase [Micromonospora sp. PPF5-6]RNL99385.1 acetoacetate--CoA ligase [Micromonospora solifontis]